MYALNLQEGWVGACVSAAVRSGSQFPRSTTFKHHQLLKLCLMCDRVTDPLVSAYGCCCLLLRWRRGVIRELFLKWPKRSTRCFPFRN